MPDLAATATALGVVAAVLALLGVYVRLRSRWLTVAEAVVENGAGPIGVMVVRWGGPTNRKHRAAAMYLGPWRGAGERVGIRYPAKRPERIEILGPGTRGVYVFAASILAAAAGVVVGLVALVSG